jgi:putative flippase GtrA
VSQARAAARPLLEKLAGEFGRYLVVSAVALAFDYALLRLLADGAGLHYRAANAISFTLGAVLAYWLSVRFVFDEHRIRDTRAELAMFVGTGLVALGVQQLLMTASVEWAGLPYAWAKLPAAGGSFVINFALRRALLFTARED